MRYVILAICVLSLLMMACADDNSSSQSAIKLNENQVNVSEMSKMADYVSGLFVKWNEGVYESLDNRHFTDRMVSVLTPDKQREEFEGNINPTYGEFRQLHYADTWKKGDLIMYRFRGVFSGGKGSPQIRVVVDNEGKISGLWVRKWGEEVH